MVAGLTRRRGRARSWSWAVGLNLAALGALAAVFAASGEVGGLVGRGPGWVWGLGPALVLGALGFRFPRSLGIPLIALVGLGIALVGPALEAYRPLGAEVPVRRAQALVGDDPTQVFAATLEVFDPPDGVPGLPDLAVRWRPPGTSGPPWWADLEALGWARTSSPPVPDPVVTYGVYQLVASDRPLRWRLTVPTPGLP